MFYSSTKITSSDSDIDEAFKAMHQSTMKNNRKKC